MREFWARQRLLVVAPHPDDETYGCGGVIAKVKGAGGEVFLQVMSLADLPQHAHGGAVVTEETRRNELVRAAEILGIDGFEVLFTDEESHLRLDAKPLRELIAFIEFEGRYALNRLYPTMVLLPYPSFNQDHEATYKAGVAACRPADPGKKQVPSHVWAYEYPLHCWGSDPPFVPRCYVDISTELERKCEALSAYASQRQEEPHPLSPAGVRDLARLRGRAVGAAAAEAFTPLRLVL